MIICREELVKCRRMCGVGDRIAKLMCLWPEPIMKIEIHTILHVLFTVFCQILSALQTKRLYSFPRLEVNHAKMACQIASDYLTSTI